LDSVCELAGGLACGLGGWVCEFAIESTWEFACIIQNNDKIVNAFFMVIFLIMV